MSDVRPIIYLIGGAGGAGKTTLAAALARELGIGWLQADSTWLALKSITTMESHPELRFFPELEGTAVDFVQFARQFQDACAIVGRAIEAGFDQEIEGRPAGFVIEGTWLQPRWMANVRRANQNADIRSLVVHEEEGSQLLQSLMDRSRVTEATPQQREFARLSWAIGQELLAEAEANAIAVVAARPRSTLTQRALAAFEAQSPRGGE